MREIEKILEEIEDLQDISGWDLQTVQGILGIVRKHMSGKDSNVPTDDGWIPVEERLPKYKERCGNDDNGNQYMKRLEIAYMTDTVEYTHGYYDGHKWLDKRHDIISNVIAWRVHEPYYPERSGK
ncbi:MAG TPA: hypothetical protein H9716_01785 [Candidatus Enterocloster faecavium]|uniref:DUF551 domain-containing protein n=1 Tax=Candidatus Enterocloster faecavium TaxID=2838560 RepID=A0A9D2RJV6_9FIRM|nr:hypothetical protein [Candidatus Enterocloster faecavium]